MEVMIKSQIISLHTFYFTSTPKEKRNHTLVTIPHTTHSNIPLLPSSFQLHHHPYVVTLYLKRSRRTYSSNQMKISRGKLPLSIMVIVICAIAFAGVIFTEDLRALTGISIFKFKACCKVSAGNSRL